MTAEFITGGDELFKAAEDCGSIISPDKTFIADKTSVCAFSGHRLLGQDFDRALLERIAEGIMKRGYRTFLCGMAKGFDLVAAETVLKLKGMYDAELIACIPYEGQAEYFSLSDRERYENILKYCSQKIIFSEKYKRWCMHARDRFMAENCSSLICYLRKNSGGTFYTVNYARRQGVKIIEI